jgi:hypothetical protein
MFRHWRRALGSLILLVSMRQALAAQERGLSGYTPLVAEAAQPGLSAVIALSISNAPLREALSTIARAASLSLTFDDALPGLDRRVSLRADHITASAALLKVLSGSQLRAVVASNGHVVLLHRDESPAQSLTRGVVRDSETAAPLGGARVEVVGEHFTALANDDGNFVLGAVPAGTYTLRVSRLGYRPLTERFSLGPAASEPLAIGLVRAPIPLAAMVVTPGTFGLMVTSLATPQTMTRQHIETVPQIGDDIYRAVTRLPGVQAGDFSAKFGVRGASGDELYVSLDGLELVEPFHLKDVQGGAFSILDSRAIGGVELTTGGYTAEYGDRLTGVFTMRSVEPVTEGIRTSLGLSVMNARVTSQGGFAKGRGGWLASARRGYLDIALKLANANDSLNPRYHDLFGKVQFDFGRAGRVSAHALYAGDDMRYLDNPGSTYVSKYRSSYGWLTWDAMLGTRLEQHTVLSLGDLTWRRDEADVQRGQLRLMIRDRRAFSVGTVRQDWVLSLADRAVVKWGVDAKREDSDYSYAGRKKLYSLDASRQIDSTYVERNVALSPNGTRLGLYIAPRVQPVDAVTLELGMRYDRSSSTDDQLVSPRVNAAWNLRPGTTARAAWGRYSQSQPLFALQAQDGVDHFYPAERAEHRGLSLEQRLPSRILGRVEAYERKLTNPRPIYFNAGPEIDMVPELGFDRVRLDATSGRAQGLELYLSQDGGQHVDWSASYALARVEDKVGTLTIPRSVDQRHTLNGDISFRPLSNRWCLTVAGMWHSGWPYSALGFSVDTLVNTDKQFTVFMRVEPGALNTGRVSSYRRVDVRWTRYFATRTGRIALFAEVYNLFNNYNVRGYHTNLNLYYRSVSVSHPSESYIPRLPTIGINWDFGSRGR